MLMYSVIFALLGSVFYILWIRFIFLYFLSLLLNYHLIRYTINKFLFGLFLWPLIAIILIIPMFAMIYGDKFIHGTLNIQLNDWTVLVSILPGLIYPCIYFIQHYYKTIGSISKSWSNEEALTKLDAIPIEQIFENFDEKPLLQKYFRPLLGFIHKDHTEITRLMQRYPKQALPVRTLLAFYHRDPNLPRQKFKMKRYFYGFR